MCPDHPAMKFRIYRLSVFEATEEVITVLKDENLGLNQSNQILDFGNSMPSWSVAPRVTIDIPKHTRLRLSTNGFDSEIPASGSGILSMGAQ